MANKKPAILSQDRIGRAPCQRPISNTLLLMCDFFLFQSGYKKDFTMEFSRDRKSMSVCATPIKPSKLGPGTKFFVKV